MGNSSNSDFDKNNEKIVGYGKYKVIGHVTKGSCFPCQWGIHSKCSDEVTRALGYVTGKKANCYCMWKNHVFKYGPS